MKDRKNTVAWKLDRAILFCFCIFIAVVFVGLRKYVVVFSLGLLTGHNTN